MKKLSTIFLASATAALVINGAATAQADEVAEATAETTPVATIAPEATTETAVDSPVEATEDAEVSSDVVDAGNPDEEATEEKDPIETLKTVLKWVGFVATFLVGGIPGALAYIPVLLK